MNSFAPSLQSSDAGFPVFSSFRTRKERGELRGLGELTHVDAQPAPAPQTPGPALRPPVPREARGRVRSAVRGEGAPLRSPFLPTGERTPQSCVSARLRVLSPAPSLSPQTLLESLTVSVTYSHPQVPVPKPPFSAFQQNSARALSPPAPNVTRSNLPQAAPAHPLLSPPRTRVQPSFQTRAALLFSPGLVPEPEPRTTGSQPRRPLLAPPSLTSPSVPPRAVSWSLLPPKFSRFPGQTSLRPLRSASQDICPRATPPTHPPPRGSSAGASPSCVRWDGGEGTRGPARGRAGSEKGSEPKGSGPQGGRAQRRAGAAPPGRGGHGWSAVSPREGSAFTR